MEGEPKPHRHWLLPLRMLLAGLLITVCTGGAVATAGLLQLKDFTDEFRDLSHEAPLRKGTVERAAPGKPQTILLVGSDHRFGDGKDDARSDTMMLVRIDPDQSAITVLSVPRDLAVEIPGRGLAKINEAYTLGGLDLVARTIKDLLGKSQRFPINHAITTTFGGFVEAVNQIGCVYVDVDRRYYHSNLGQPVSEHYAEINVRAGYQELCGTRALEYVRFRHLDNDIVRAARQQDFLRAAKDQLRDQGVLRNLRPLARIVAKATETDGDLRTTQGILRLAKILVGSSGKPIRQIHFPVTFVAPSAPVQEGQPFTTATAALGSYVTSTPEQIDQAVHEFMHPGPVKQIRTRTRKRHGHKARRSTVEMRNALGEGQALVKGIHVREATRMPVYVPRAVTPRAAFAQSTADAPNPRRYVIRGPRGHKFAAYRLVLVENATKGQYYGVQGTTWRNPPLLAAAHQTRRIGGRTYRLYIDGGRLRIVAWYTPKAVYWVSNTLSQDLTNQQMLAIASSLTRARTSR